MGAPTILIALVLVFGFLPLQGPGVDLVRADNHQADLVVVAVTFGEAAHGHEITVSVKNQGAATSLAFGTRIQVASILEQTVYLYGTTGSGQTRSFTHQVHDWLPGTHTVNVTTDASNVVSESNELNNHHLQQVTLDTGPDLIIQTLDIVPRFNGHTVQAVIHNAGKNTSRSFVAKLTGPDGAEDSSTRYGLLENQSWTVELYLNKWYPGSQTITAIVDLDGVVPESNEDNNQLQRTRTVTTGPDLRIVDLRTPDTRIVLGEPIAVFWDQQNIGTHNASAVPHVVSFVGGAEIERYDSWLDAGTTRASSAYEIAAPGVGNHTIRVQIDPDHTLGDVTRGPDTYDLPVRVHQPTPLRFNQIWIHNATTWNGDNRTEQVSVYVEVNGDHIAERVWFRLYDGNELIAQTEQLMDQSWYGGRFQYHEHKGFHYDDDAGEYMNWRQTVFDVPTPPSHEGRYRAVIQVDNGTAWQSAGEGDAIRFIPPHGDPPPPPEPPVPPRTRLTPTADPVAEPDLPSPDEVPVALRVEHIDTMPDPRQPGSYLLRFLVTGLGEGGTSTDLGVTHKVGWQINILTRDQDIAEGERATYEMRVTPPDTGRTSSTITVGAWAEGARAETIVVNMRSLSTAGTAAGHPVPVWGYATGGALTVMAAGAFVWFAEPRRYGFLRYLLAMFPVIGGFSRIQGEKVLEHEARERIHQAIESQPGIHYRALLRELQMSNGRLAHHLQTLEREGIIRTESTAGKLHLYVTGSTAVRGTPLSDRQRALLGMIKKEPGILQSRLADRLGVSRQALHQHLDGLREQNLLLDARYGRTRALYLESDADQRLTVCGGCQSFYDRGQGMVSGVVCPSCGQAS